MAKYDRKTGEFKCEVCRKWHALPTHAYGFKTVCKSCKDTLEADDEMLVDKFLTGRDVDGGH